jgi:hypothetical protein
MHTKEKQAEYQRKHYQGNKEYYKQKANERKVALREWFQEFKATLKCGRCEENHPACLDFHHKDPAEKEFALYQALQRGLGKKKILAEIEKCEILCSNCHRKHHYSERSSAG